MLLANHEDYLFSGCKKSNLHLLYIVETFSLSTQCYLVGLILRDQRQTNVLPMISYV